MRISDWSSDVCSSDLLVHRQHDPPGALACRGFFHRGAKLRQGIALCDGGTQRPRGRQCEDPVAVRVALFRLEQAELADVDADQRAALEQRQVGPQRGDRSEEHTSELQSLMRISYAVFCLKQK